MAAMSEASDKGGSYANPPILEVVLELRFAEPVAETRVRYASERAISRYAHRAEQNQVEAVANFETRNAQFNITGMMLRHTSSDQTELLSISTNNVAWAKRAPYDGWASFVSRVEAELGPVLKALQYPKSSRIGLRYINRIDVPIENDLVTYENYINFRINAGPLLEPSNGYTWVIRSFRPEENLHVTLQSAAVAPEIPETGAFTFDIDVSSEGENPDAPEDILALLEKMRILKNKIFESGITDRARGMYR